MAEYTPDEWAGLAESLTKQFGQDTAQEALCRLFEALQQGKAIKNPEGYAVRVCQTIAYQEAHPKAQRTSLDAVMAQSDNGRPVPDVLINHSNPESLILRKEREANEEKLQEAYLQRCGAGWTIRQNRYYWRKKYQHSSEELD